MRIMAWQPYNNSLEKNDKKEGKEEINIEWKGGLGR